MAKAQAARRRPGEGSYYYDAKRGLHFYRIDLGVDPETGRRLTRNVSSKDHAKALDKFNKLRDQRRDYGSVPTRSQTLGQWLTHWLDDVVTVRPNVHKNYESRVRCYLMPKLGRKRLDALSTGDVRDLHRWMESKALAPATIRGAHRVLSIALNEAMAHEVLHRNVASLVSPPPLGESKRKALTPEEVQTFVDATKADRLAARHVTAFLTGERQGEVLGMEWDRVNLDEAVVDVAWQLQRLPYRHGCGKAQAGAWPCGKKRAGSCPSRELAVRKEFVVRPLHGALCLTRPKSKKSQRLVPLHPHLVVLLRERAQAQADEPNPHGLVFTEPDGRPIDPSNDNEAWHDALERAGLPSVPLHNARHTTGTNLRRADTDRDVIKDIMGHSTPAVTSDYLDADMTLMRAAVMDLGERLRFTTK